jgi:hypothetical protein
VGRKSSIVRGPQEVRATIDKLIRKGQLTLAEIRQYVADHHGTEHAPSLSTIHRYSQQVASLIEKMRDIDIAARAVVEELGESPDDRAGALLVQSITTAATQVALRAQDDEHTSVDDVRKLARMGKDLIQARRVDRHERKDIEKTARERQVREQAEALDAMVKSKGLSAETADAIRKQVLGVQ